ncbi:MAG: GYF domain-containing protein [Chthoniobacteraceae bacterium]
MDTYLYFNGQQHGPYSQSDVQASLDAGDIDPSTLCYQEGMSDWAPLSSRFQIRQPESASLPRTISETVPSRGQESAAITQSPALWNPRAAIGWSLLFGTAFGAWLQARNADALGNPSEAKVQRAWFKWTLAFQLVDLVANLFIKQEGFFLILGACPLAVLLIWYFTTGQKQTLFVKATYGSSYQRKSWAVPLVIGFGYLFGVVLINGLVAESVVIAAMANASQASATDAGGGNNPAVSKDPATAPLGASTQGLLSKDEAHQKGLAAIGFIQGLGVEKNLALAAKLAKASAEGGDAVGERIYGGFLFTGEGGVPKDPAQGVEWFKKAYLQGDVDSSYNLGYAYLKGTGVKQDSKIAVNYFQAGTEKGNLQAKLYLGLAYLRGDGIDQDMDQGKKLILEAAADGEPMAIKWVQLLGLDKKSENGSNDPQSAGDIPVVDVKKAEDMSITAMAYRPQTFEKKTYHLVTFHVIQVLPDHILMVADFVKNQPQALLTFPSNALRDITIPVGPSLGKAYGAYIGMISVDMTDGSQLSLPAFYCTTLSLNEQMILGDPSLEK